MFATVSLLALSPASSSVAPYVPSSLAKHSLDYWEQYYAVDGGSWDNWEIDYQTIHHVISDRLGGVQIKRALIPGCGTSTITQQLAETIDGVRTIGVDFSNAVVEAMRERTPAEFATRNTISYVHMDVLEMGQSFGKDTIDLIVDKSMMDTLRLRPDAGNAVSSYLETLHFLLNPEGGLAVFVSPVRPVDMVPILHRHPTNGFHCGDVRGVPRRRPLNEKFESLDPSFTNVTVYVCRHTLPGESNADIVFPDAIMANAAMKKAERDARKFKADQRAEEESRKYREKMAQMKADISQMESQRKQMEVQRQADEAAELARLEAETEAWKQEMARKEADAAEERRREAEEQEAQEAAAKSSAAAKKKKKGDVHCVGFWDDWSSCDESTCSMTRTFSIMSAQKGEGRPCEAQDGEQQVQVCDAPCASDAAPSVRPSDLHQTAVTLDASSVVTSSAETVPLAAQPIEYRIDVADGNAYPIEEFQMYYPADWQERWEAAPVYTIIQPQPEAAPAPVPAAPEAPAVPDVVEEPATTAVVEPPVRDLDCFAVWSDWTNCQADCQMRRTISHKIKQSGNGEKCEYDEGFTQQVECFHGGCKPNCVGEWSAWSECPSTFDETGSCGIQTRTFSVISPKKRPSDANCEAENGAEDTRECLCTSAKPEPVRDPNAEDCEAFWTERTACGPDCTQELEYTVLQADSHGGIACEFEDGYVISKQCSGGECISNSEL